MILIYNFLTFLEFEIMNDDNYMFTQKYLPISLVLVSPDPSSLTRRYDVIISSQISPIKSVLEINAMKFMTRFYIKNQNLCCVFDRYVKSLRN